MTFVVCINNQDYPASLEIRKIYQTLPDPEAIAHQMIRVIDESGEDYLYPSSYFMAIALSEPLQQALAISPS
ncbi:hypothetical protein [Roseofilum acuticapitatum]